MPKNTILTPGTAGAIEDRVARVLRDLGNPEPPLCLADVRELLRLDLKHYSSTDVTWLQEKIHKMKIAGKQVLARPRLMLEVVTKLDLKALILLDRKRVFIDAGRAPLQQRWSEAHEIVHEILPWHEAVAMGDKKQTLSLSCHSQVESEANYGAGRLLFLGSRFTDELAGHASIDFDTIKILKKSFGNSLTTTLWRVVENLDRPALGLVSIHPKAAPEPGASPVRYFIRSGAFAKLFPAVTEFDLFLMIQRFCYGRRGPLGSGEVVLQDASGQEHVFFMETFFNGHDALTLGVCRKLHTMAVAIGR